MVSQERLGSNHLCIGFLNFFQIGLMEILVNTYKSELPAELPFIWNVFCGLSDSPGSLVICIRSDRLRQITSDL